MSRRGVDSFLKSRPDDFCRRVERGIPPEHRWTVWKARLLAANTITSAREAQEREKALFSGPSSATQVAGLLNRESCIWSKEIREDAARTFPELPSFTEEHEQSFCRVLNAYCFLNPQVGYVQGMGFIVGVLLLASGRSEQEALFVFVRLMEDCGLKGLYSDDKPLLEQYVQMFDQLMEELLPELKNHFDNEGVQSSEYIKQWFLSLFVYCLPLETVLLIWDSVMCNGLHHIVLAAIALLGSVKEVLLAKQHEEILQFFKSMKRGEDELTAAEVGRCIAHKIGRLSKMQSVQRMLGAEAVAENVSQRSTACQTVELGDENVQRKSEAGAKNPSAVVRSPSSKERRVRFSFDANTDKNGKNIEEGSGISISWYQQ